MRQTKHVSNEEIAAKMKEPLRLLLRQTVKREPTKPANQKHEPQKKKKQKKQGQSQKPEKTNAADEKQTLSEDEHAYLNSVFENVLLTTTMRRNALGLSSDKANTVKKRLIENELVEQIAPNLGPRVGGTVKLIMLTAHGYEAIGKEPRNIRPKIVGPEHWFWQLQIAKFYREKGHPAKIEKWLNGKHADIGVIIKKREIAIEVAMRPYNEIRNIKAALNSGFDRVVVACRDSRVKHAIEERMGAALTGEETRRCKIMLLTDFSFVETLIHKPTKRRNDKRVTTPKKN